MVEIAKWQNCEIANWNRLRPLFTTRHIDAQSLGLDSKVEQLGATCDERCTYGGGLVGRSQAKQTSSAAGSTHLGGLSTRGAGASDQIVDLWGTDAGGEAFAVAPFLGEIVSNCLPVLAFEGSAHRDRGVANPLEAVEHIPIALDMSSQLLVPELRGAPV